MNRTFSQAQTNSKFEIKEKLVELKIGNIRANKSF